MVTLVVAAYGDTVVVVVVVAACGDTFLSPSLLKAQLAAAYAKSNHDAVSAMEVGVRSQTDCSSCSSFK